MRFFLFCLGYAYFFFGNYSQIKPNHGPIFSLLLLIDIIYNTKVLYRVLAIKVRDPSRRRDNGDLTLVKMVIIMFSARQDGGI